MKLMTKTRVLNVAFTLMLFFFVSCNNEDFEKPTTAGIAKQLQDNLKLDQFTNQNLVVNWESLRKTEKDSSEIYEIEVTEKIKSEMTSKFLQKEVKYELIAVKNKDEVHSYLIEAFSNLNYETFPSTIKNLNKFAGTLNVYELNGTKIGQVVIFEGKAEDPSNNKFLSSLVSTINMFYKSNNLTNRVPACNVILNTYSVEQVWTGRYSIATLASTGQVLSIKYLGETLTSSKSTLLFSEVFPCGSSGIHEPKSATIHKIRTEAYEKTVVDDSVIIDETLEKNPCLYGVYTKLGGVDTFQKYLRKFDNKFSVLDLKISVDDRYGINHKDNLGAQAITTIPANKTINIIFNNDPNLASNIMKFPQISIATNFIHEIIHAEINRQLSTASTDTNINPTKMSDSQWKSYVNNIKNDFPQMFGYYSKYVLKTATPSDFQHQYMADKYRGVIKEALKQYDKNLHNEDYYDALSWNGLKNTAAWNKLSDTEKTKILQTIQTIYKNGTYCN